ncbi:BspA family leucine-rich repeat surface protein [Niabella yanshanensis]|uniref:BspA family leucine-rich repeat surface protein n=1 Tax=Niabella yanshanensis TaxID=577386 RepID=A0ABZ0W8K0_9BACT|nr:BspA family leucine-rich repeat surface protein [Niabella yanshanensis]WQD38320.1 BspA family leucine-rich repeat surface protein [Niabella yanshanensis]
MARLVLLAHFMLLCCGLFAQHEFITEWKVSAPPYDITFPGIGINYKIEWEQKGAAGVAGVINHAGNGQLISFPGAGTYTVKVTPGVGSFRGVNSGEYPASVALLEKVTQWGTIQWSSLHFAFAGCNALDVTATDIPDLSGVKALHFMFYGCSKLVGNAHFDRWITTGVTDMSHMFSGARLFNQPIDWDMATVTDISGMFAEASLFNQPIGNWETGSVTDMQFTFTEADSFNQPIGNWKTDNVLDMSNMFRGTNSFNQPIGDWNTGKVRDMSNMFAFTSAFNQPIGGWDTRSVTNMSSMFSYASSFNQPIGSWQTNNVTNMSSVLNYASAFNHPISNWNLSGLSSNITLTGSGMDCTAYSATLEGWATSAATPDNMALAAVGMVYNASATATRQQLVNKGWSINGDTYDPDCVGNALPVHFGAVKATIRGNRIFVGWESLQEVNNDYFEVQASADGQVFHKLGDLGTQAPEGNSDSLLSYSFEAGLNGAGAAIGVTALLVILGMAGHQRKKQLLLLMTAVLLLAIISCAKQDIDRSVDREIFIRIKQVDKDGNFQYSKTVKAVRE